MRAEKTRDIWVAHYEGKIIQWKTEGGWVDEPTDPGGFLHRAGTNVCENPEYYRIKPDPVVFWVNVYSDKSAESYSDEEDAKAAAANDLDILLIIARRVELEIENPDNG